MDFVLLHITFCQCGAQRDWICHSFKQKQKKRLCFLKICKQCLDRNKNIPINGTFMPIPRDKIQHYASLNPYSGISALHSLTQEIRNNFSFSWSQVPVPIRLFFVTSERKKYIYNNTIYFYLLPTLWPFWIGFSSVSSPILGFLDVVPFCIFPSTPDRTQDPLHVSLISDLSNYLSHSLHSKYLRLEFLVPLLIDTMPHTIIKSWVDFCIAAPWIYFYLPPERYPVHYIKFQRQK